MQRDDFSYTVERKGPYGGYTCYISYKGCRVYAFGTIPDGTNQYRRRNGKCIAENAEVSIRTFLAGLSPAVSARITQIDAAKKNRIQENEKE